MTDGGGRPGRFGSDRPTSCADTPVRVSGKWLYAGDERLLLRGVTYAPHDGEPSRPARGSPRTSRNEHAGALVDLVVLELLASG